jgi:hypothetical protein
MPAQNKLLMGKSKCQSTGGRVRGNPDTIPNTHLGRLTDSKAFNVVPKPKSRAESTITAIA